MDSITTIQPIISAAIGSGLVAYYWYINNQIDPTKPTQIQFRIQKILPTVLVGALIGILSVILGVEPLTESNVAVQMLAYGLITSLVDTGLKTVYRYFGVDVEQSEGE